MMKLTPGVNFINVLCTAFALIDPESVKRYWRINCIFCAFGIYERKSCSLNVDEIDSRPYLKSHCGADMQIYERKKNTNLWKGPKYFSQGFRANIN